MFSRIVIFRYLVGFLFLILSLTQHKYVLAEIEFLSISETAVIMYDAPSLKSEKLYIASQYLPIEAVVNVAGWTKVRDSSGGLAWVERSTLSGKRYIIVTKPLADVYQNPDSNSALIFQAQENVVMEWLGTENTGWVNVRHRDGQVGYIKIDQVWGL